MKTKTHAAKLNTPVASQRGSFYRFLRKVFDGFLGGSSSDYQSDLQKVLEKLQDIEDTLEIIAREMARQTNRN